MAEAKFYQVAVDAPLHQILTYKSETELICGQWVQVPLGKRTVLGLCLGEKDGHEETRFEIKPISSVETEWPILDTHFLKWLQWVSQYYIYPLGEVAQMVLPPLRKNPKSVTRKSPVIKPQIADSPLDLTPEQAAVVESVSKHHQFSTHLIFGVTGSGKTEIYLQLLEKVLLNGQRGLVLVPEISLTPQLIERFARRFGDQIAALHSQLTDRERTNQWWDMVEGRKKILIGARSALFCPVPDLGLIVVDEEHEPSFKQDEKLKYNGRDCAIMLAKEKNCPILLGSATPSLESWKNAQEGKYHLHQLKRRVANRSLPQFEIIDLKALKSSEQKNVDYPFLPFWLSPSLYEKTKACLERKEQAAFFLNRRGMAQVVVCPACGHTKECPNCDISLTLHGQSHLVCHYCDYHENFKLKCTDCHQGELTPLGLGTELLENDLQKLFPQIRIARADRDEVQNREDLENLISQMETSEIDLLIGTQMIAKGLDFPKLKLVAFVLADVGFNLPDFRATERSFQLLTQMSGRSGRHIKENEAPGEVLVQAYNTTHDSLLFAEKTDFEGFAQHELQIRKSLNYPPYGKLSCLRIMGTQLGRVKESSEILVSRAEQLRTQHNVYQDVEILGPSEAPRSRLRGQFRYHLLIKCPQAQKLNLFIRQTLGDEKWLPPGTRIIVDVDPIHLL